jgi:hypothetical protein
VLKLSRFDNGGGTARFALLRIPLAASVISVLTACASYHGYPNPYADVSKQLPALQANFEQGKITSCEEHQQLDCRDLIVNSLVQAIDIQYDDFRQQLFRSSGGLNLASDVTVLGLSGAGTLLSPAGTKAILAGISGFVTGTKASIDKNLLFDKTVLLLIDRMDVLRAAKLLDIQKGLAKSKWADYSLPTALVDVELYYTAGTIPAAINSINAQTGGKASEVEKRTKDFKDSLGR